MADAIIVGHGSAAALDDITATAADIVAPKVGVNQNGDPITGTIASMGGQTITPSASKQTISTNKKYMTGDIVVNAVSNLSAANIKTGVTVGGVAGTFTSDATATAAQILSGKTAYVNGQKVTGTIVSMDALTITPDKSSHTISTANKYMLADIKVNAIPTNYIITTDANAAAYDIRYGRTAYVNGKKIVGKATDYTDQTFVPSGRCNWNESQGRYYIHPNDGFYNGSVLYIPRANLADDIGLNASKILVGQKIIGINGTATSDATATAAQILSGKTVYVNGQKVTGEMKNRLDYSTIVDNKHVLFASGVTVQFVTYGGYSYATFNVPDGYYNGQVRMSIQSVSLDITPSRTAYSNPVSNYNIIGSVGVGAISPKYILHGWFKNNYDYLAARGGSSYSDAVDINLYSLVNTAGEKKTVTFPTRYNHFWDRITDPEDSSKTITKGYGFTVEIYNSFDGNGSIINLHHIFVPTHSTYSTSSFHIFGGRNSVADGTNGIWKCTFQYEGGLVMQVKCIRRASVEPDQNSIKPIIRVLDQFVYLSSSFVKSHGLSSSTWGRV